ncbi:MAG: hypothetical protein LBU38_06415 [Propionibacteriaceae bacterium]|jgi:hypothetical protein|nr:hypothetical protein [Propionibacteriaceae bacterium]
MSFLGQRVGAAVFVALLLAFSPAVSAFAQTPSPISPAPSLSEESVVPSGSPSGAVSSSPASATPGDSEADLPDDFLDSPDKATDDSRTFIAIGVGVGVAVIAGIVVFAVKK